MGLLHGPRRALLGGQKLRPFDFGPTRVFTPSMAKRVGTVFAGGVMVQGHWDGSGTPDALSFGRGAQISGNFYANVDANQGSVAFWITPEWAGNDGKIHAILSGWANTYSVFWNYQNVWYFYIPQ